MIPTGQISGQMTQVARHQWLVGHHTSGSGLAGSLLAIAFVSSFFRQYPAVRALSLALPAMVMLVLLARRHSWPAWRLPWFLIIFYVWVSLSILWTEDQRGTLAELSHVVPFVLVGASSGLLLTVKEIRRILTQSVKGVLMVTAISLVVAPGWATRPNPADPVPGWHGPFDHKNGLGFFLVIATVCILLDDSRRRRWWGLVIVVLLAGAQSSTGVLTSVLVVAMGMWWRFGLGAQLNPRRAARRIILGLAVALAAVGALLRPDVLAGALGRSVTLTGRTEVWDPVMREIGEQPVFGLGWGGVWRETPTTLQIWREARFDAYYAHNAYLDVALQVGLVGLLLLLCALVLALAVTYRLPLGPDRSFLLLLLMVHTFAGISESGPFTGAAGTLLLVASVTAAAQRGGSTAAPG